MARRAYDLLVNDYRIPPEDIIFDPLIFPVGTGRRNLHRICPGNHGGIRLDQGRIARMQHHPRDIQCFLRFAPRRSGSAERGLSIPLHPGGVGLCHRQYGDGWSATLRFPKQSENRRRCSSSEPTKKIMTMFWRNSLDFTGRKSRHRKREVQSLPLEERLARYVVEGSKDGLIPDLEEALQKYKPLEIINGPLMKGMDEVGRSVQ